MKEPLSLFLKSITDSRDFQNKVRDLLDSNKYKADEWASYFLSIRPNEIQESHWWILFQEITSRNIITGCSNKFQIKLANVIVEYFSTLVSTDTYYSKHIEKYSCYL